MSPARVLLCFVLAILIAEQSAQPFESPPSVMTRDDIKKAREKFDREMKLDTKRPWDGMVLTGPHALEKPHETDKK